MIRMLLEDQQQQRNGNSNSNPAEEQPQEPPLSPTETHVKTNKEAGDTKFNLLTANVHDIIIVQDQNRTT